jgi:type IV pilus assembly protein PilY1
MHSWTPHFRRLLTGLVLLGAAGIASAQLGNSTADTPACCQLTTSLIQDVLRGNDPSGDERFFSAEGAPPNLHFIIDVSGSMKELPQIINSDYKAFYDATVNGCENPALQAFSDSHEWNPNFQYPVPDTGTGLGSDTGFPNLFLDNRYYGNGLWQYSSSPPFQWSTKEQACQTQIGSTWNKPSGSAQYARCLQCLQTKGYFKVFNSTSSSEQFQDFILWGRFLNFNPPKYVTAKAVLKQVFKDLRRVRVGISIFTGTSSNFQKMQPSCQQILQDPEAFSAFRTDYIAKINSLQFTTSTPLARSLLNAGYYFTSGQDIYKDIFGFGASSPLGYTYPTDFKSDALTAETRTVCWGCQSSSIIMITDGEPNNDTLGTNIVPKIRTLNGGKVNCPPSAPCPDASNDTNYMLDDVAKLLANQDLQRNTPATVGNMDTSGLQSLNIYTVGFGINSNLLKNTAEVGNGLYYTAEDATALKAALLAIINNVQTRSTSFSAVASNSLQVRDAGATVIPRFKPARNKAQPWQGFLYRFDLASEKVLGCTPGGNKDLNSDGDCDDTHLIDKDGDSVVENDQGDFVKLKSPNVKGVPFWEAGSVLKPAAQVNNPADPERTMRRWKDRKVFTIIDNNPGGADGKLDNRDTPVEFSVANAALLREYLGISQNTNECDDLKAQLGRSSLTPDECAALVIQWYLGADIFTPPPAGQTEPYDRPFFLQDVFHSSPVSVDPPISKFFCAFSPQCTQTLFSNLGAKNQQGYTDVPTGDAYDMYVNKAGKRDKIILVGSNGGMIHAFHNGSNTGEDPYTGIGTYDAGTGKELWAFVPPDMLPKLRPNMGKHGYFTDGTPLVRDVWMDGVGSQVAQRDGVKQWDEYRTVAVVGSGRGGVHRFALDLSKLLAENFDTDPSKVKTVFKQPGIFLWMWPQPCDELSLQVGESFTNYAPMPPPIIPVAVEPETDNQLAKIANPTDNASPQPVQPPVIANKEARERWMVLFNGGYDPYLSRGRGLAMVDMASGHTVWSFFHGDGKKRSEHLLYPFAAGITTQDIGEAVKPYQDADTLMDTATVGDFGGQMWVLRFWKPGKWNASTKKISNWFAARSFRVAPESGSVNSEKVRAPFTTMAVNAIQPGTGYMRTYIGTSDMQNLYDRGSVCRLSNPHACAVQGCKMNNTISIKRGSTLAWRSTSPFQNQTLDTTTAVSQVQNAVGACGGVEAQVNWSYVGGGSCGYSSSGTLKYTCSGNTSTWACTQPTNNWVTINFANAAQPYPQYYFGFHSYGGKTRRFDKLPLSGQTEDDDAAADVFESDMLTQTDPRLKNVSAFSNDGYESGTTEADPMGSGWYIQYKQGNERTGNTGTLANGCMLWSSFEPSGSSGAVCSTTGDNKARIYQADFATGRANCATSFFDEDSKKWARYVEFTTVAVAPSFSTRLTMVNGQISLDLPLLAAGLKRPGGGGGSDQGVPTQEVARSDSAVQAFYQLELDRKAHDCRHEGKNCDSP